MAVPDPDRAVLWVRRDVYNVDVDVAVSHVTLHLQLDELPGIRIDTPETTAVPYRYCKNKPGKRFDNYEDTLQLIFASKSHLFSIYENIPVQRNSK